VTDGGRATRFGRTVTRGGSNQLSSMGDQLGHRRSELVMRLDEVEEAGALERVL
jgi:hypothetical protein